MPSFPPSLQTVEVRVGPFLGSDGQPLAGRKVVLTPEWPVDHEPTGLTVLATSAEAVLGGDGAGSVVVPASDAAGLKRRNHRYWVTFDFGRTPTPRDPFYVRLPAADPVVRLSGLMPAQGSDGAVVHLPVVTSIAGFSGAVTGAMLGDNEEFVDAFLGSLPAGYDDSDAQAALAPALQTKADLVDGAVPTSQLPARLSQAELRAAYLPKWTATTAYAQGDAVVNPAGEVVKALAAFTSATVYDASKWSVPASAVPDATALAKGKVALLGDLAGTADAPRLRTQTRNERSTLPVLTKLDNSVIGTIAQIGLPTIYVPWLYRVSDAVFAAYPEFGRWRCDTSTDHDTGDGGVATGVCPDDDITGAGKWTWLRNNGSPVMFKDGANRQTETPCTVFNPETNLFHRYYQIAVGTTQTTRVATSPNGVTNWTIVGDAIPNLPASVAGWNHTGYARVYYLDGNWAAWHLQGTGATSAYGWSWSKDGFNFTTDRRRVGAAVQMTDGVLRFGISTLIKFRGDLWAIGTQSEYVSGASSSGVSNVWGAPISLASDLRQLLGRPQLLGGVQGSPTAFATHPDGRLFGARREGTASTGSLSLAVLA